MSHVRPAIYSHPTGSRHDHGAVLIVIAINTTTTAGDASSAGRAIESYAKAAMWMLAISCVATSIYIAFRPER